MASSETPADLPEPHLQGSCAFACSGDDLYVGGTFTNAGGKASVYVAHWGPTASVVAPWITSVSFTNGDTVIRFTTQAGQAYSLWRKNDLQEPAWASLTNDIPGSGSIQSVADPGAAAVPQRFYRLSTHK